MYRHKLITDYIKTCVGVFILGYCLILSPFVLASGAKLNNKGHDASSFIMAERLVKRVRNKAEFSCVDCHGETGNIIDSTDHTPRLAGQDMSYLYDQLINFKQGRRPTKEMDGILAGYSDQELQLMAHYYASQTVNVSSDFDVTIDPILPHTKVDDDNWATEGKRLFMEGDKVRGIIACQNCHGTYGEGRIIGLDKAPKITAQHASYTRKTLKQYATNERTTDNIYNNVMQDIAKTLNEEDIRNLAAYIQRLRDPK